MLEPVLHDAELELTAIPVPDGVLGAPVHNGIKQERRPSRSGIVSVIFYSFFLGGGLDLKKDKKAPARAQ